MITTKTFGSPLSWRWRKVYYLFGIPVRFKDMHKEGERVFKALKD